MNPKQSTWIFEHKPYIVAASTVGGPLEAAGHIKDDFDLLYDDMRLNEDSFEKAQQRMLEETATHAIVKANLTNQDIDCFIAGDLINQLTPTNQAAHTIGIPYLGVFSACATITESLAIGAMLCNQGHAKYVLSGASSHNSAAERQFRFPTEYGAQKPPTSQCTVTGGGCAIIGQHGSGPQITSATIGKVIDKGITDPFNMGGAMAPAAVDTIITHLQDLNIDASYYDLILTGDLGKVGREVSLEMLSNQGIKLDESRYQDCGLTIYTENQPVHAGASGPACCAVVTFGHILNKLRSGQLNKILVVATGALHSPLSINQQQSIPCIAHAIAIENEGDAS